jgi:polyphosphate kinase
MHRNLDARVEALIQVVDDSARSELDSILSAAMSDQREAFDLGADGTWARRVSTPEAPLTDLQQVLLLQVMRG